MNDIPSDPVQPPVGPAQPAVPPPAVPPSPLPAPTASPPAAPPSTGNPGPFWQRALDVIRRPRSFFAELAAEDRLGPTAGYFLVWWTLTALLLAWSIDRSFLGYAFGSLGSIFLVYWLIGLVAFPIQVGIFHLILTKFFKGQGTFVQTFQALVYGAAPAIIIGAFPLTFLTIVAIPISLYAWYLIGIGLMTLHRVSVGQVIGAVITNVVVTSILTWLLALSFGGLLTRALYGGFTNPYTSLGTGSKSSSGSTTTDSSGKLPSDTSFATECEFYVPGSGETLSEPPYQVTVYAEVGCGELRERGTTLKIVGAAGRDVVSATEITTTIGAILAEIDDSAPDGAYTIRYTACFDDGTCKSGESKFTLNRP